MDDLRLDSRAYDPAHINAVLREARRMRNEVLIDLVKSLFDGRLATRVFGNAPTDTITYHKPSHMRG